MLNATYETNFVRHFGGFLAFFLLKIFWHFLGYSATKFPVFTGTDDVNIYVQDRQTDRQTNSKA